MSQGQGSVTVNQKPPVNSPSGPPFTSTSADNGLSVDPVSHRIVFGQTFGAVGNPAQLLSSREIPMQGFTFRMNNNGFNKLQINNATGTYQFGDAATEVNGTHLGILDAVKSAHIASGGSNYFLIDVLNGLYNIGDLGSVLNSTQFNIDDVNRTFAMLSGGNPYFGISVPAGTFSFGDLASTVNGTALIMNDAGNVASIRNSAGLMLELDRTTGLYRFGDVSNVSSGTYLEIDDPNTHVRFRNALGDPGLDINFTAGFYRLGDSDGGVNNTYISVADSVQKLLIFATNGIDINGSAGFTGTVTPVNTITVVGGIVTNVA